MTNAYDTGRLDLPFVGIATFGKRPYQPDWDAIDADIAILGAPFDGGTQSACRNHNISPRALSAPSRSCSPRHGLDVK